MPFVKFIPSNDSRCRRKSSGTMYSASVMILTSSCFLVTSFLLASLRDAERDLVVRGSNTGMFLDRFDSLADGCELFSLLTPPFFFVDFLSPASFLVAALEDARAAGLDVSSSSFSLALLLRPRPLDLVEAAVLVDAEAFFFLDFVSFGTAASFASASPVTLATSPFCHREKLWWMALAIKEWIY